MQKPVALVTGASSGIGLELSRLLAAGGHDLVLVARSAERLDRVARDLQNQSGVRVRIQPSDLSQVGAAHRLWRRLMDDGVAVDVLVNNAGIGLHGPFSAQHIAEIDRLIAVNVTAVTTLTRLALPEMLARRRGRILNVASLVAFQPGGPLEAIYYATKAYVLSFSKGLARELRGSGATETVLYQLMPSASPAVVARGGYRGLMRGSSAVIPGLLTKILAFAGKLPPRRVALEVNRLLLQPRSKSKTVRAQDVIP
jgi:short-subunit dehydrogenase